MILLNILFSVVFSYFAFLNFNDPDAWLWVSIYLLAAVCCLAAIFGIFFPIVYLIAISFYIIYAFFIFFSKDGVWDWMTKYHMQNIAATMQAKKPWIEKTREFFGLLIASGALLLNFFLGG